MSEGMDKGRGGDSRSAIRRDDVSGVQAAAKPRRDARSVPEIFGGAEAVGGGNTPDRRGESKGQR